MSDATVRGRFSWHELTTTDPKAAAGFFSKVVGWKTQAWEQDPSYEMFVIDGRPIAGLLQMGADVKAKGSAPSWLSYIGTPDATAAGRQAVLLGGKIVKPLVEIPTVGRFVVLEDPQGAVFAAFTPERAPVADAAPAVGEFSWHELATTDWRAALTFYQQLFGWEETSAMDMGPELGTYQMFGWAGRPAGGIYNKPPHMQGPPMWLPYIRVADSKKAATTVKQIGGQIVNGPMEVPGGDWIAMGVDPQGGSFAVHSVKPAAAAKAAGGRTRAAKSKPPTRKVAKAKKKTAQAKTKTKTRVRAKSKARTKTKAAKRPAAARRRSAKKTRRTSSRRRR
jgi:predicted enzyme related to lactoylglutathione lyase